MRYYVVDAFAKQVFGGNPAGVCVLEQPLEAESMQQIASENNLSETAFVYKREAGKYDLRWFTPKAEIDLCGHATLGTAYVIAHFVDPDVEKMEFDTCSGILTVVKKGELLEMDFPSRMPEEIPVTEEMVQALGGQKIKAAYLSRDLILELEDMEAVQQVTPDFARVLALKDGLGCVVTAQGKDCDFVSRCFFPKLGVNEDPVTGSAHSSLIPFWAKRLQKTEMTAEQLSARGGVLVVADCGERVRIAGSAVLYLQGTLEV